MAVAAAAAGTALTDTGNVASYATASWTPTASRLVLVAVTNAQSGGTTAPSSVTGNGLTYVQVDTVQRTDTQRQVSIYRAWSGASPSAGAITVAFAGSQQGCLVHISQWTGTDGSADNGASAIVQSVEANWASTSNPSITLAAFADANNGTYGALNHGAAMTAGSGFTLLTDNSHATPTSEMLTEWQAGNDTTVDVTAGAGQGCGLAVEIKVAPIAAAQIPYRNPMPPLIAQ